MKKLTLIFILLFCCICYSKPVKITRQYKTMNLPSPDTKGEITLAEAINYRRNIRDFTPEPLRVEQIAQLAWAAQGITDKEKGLRATASAGDIYPMQLYIAVTDGLYRYNPESHSITKTIDRDIRRKLYSATFMRRAVTDAPCSFIISGSARKFEEKYRNRGERLISLEAGAMAQNIQLQAVALGLGSTTIAVLDSKGIAKACNLNAQQEPLYIISIGYSIQPAPIVPGKRKAADKAVKEPKTLKAVFIIPRKRFRDVELFDSDMILNTAGVDTTIASSKLGRIRGMAGQMAIATILVKDIVVDDYDAVIFIGGVGSDEYLRDRNALNVARQAMKKGKILAAIAEAPAILAKAGVVRGRTVTSLYAERMVIIKAGGNWTINDVEHDGQLVTANSFIVSKRFGTEILVALRNNP